MSELLGAIDAPQRHADCQSILRVSGWCIREDGVLPTSIVVLVDAVPAAELTNCYRTDVARLYPAIDFAASCGFYGDVVLDEGRAGVLTTLEVVAHFGAEQYSVGTVDVLYQQPYPLRTYPPKPFDLRDVLLPNLNPKAVADALHVHDNGVVPLFRLIEPLDRTHPYSSRMRGLIDRLESGQLALDLGSGMRPAHLCFDNVVRLDAVHFQSVEIVNTRSQLPFKDRTFDLVVSSAVFEHLPDPHGMASEIFRILKPGGEVLVDTAFMQPLHGDPSHYFNMTKYGLRKIFAGFEILSEPLQRHHWPSQGLLMQLQAVRPFVDDANGWAATLDGFVRELGDRSDELDEALGPVGREILAAGVSIHARRPSS
ncbi:class I SAM-dependent methyltransferase [Methylobacterium oxalidis]|uniref:Methyltransferase type 11 domain-containing protein n=1 Tax=Methylobacterium oxalidis TaxID=944322 RepID=A0A512IYB4_9HYPH|nr:class I SAM-dependent methyltransferase [Methylobacterium oxalidis]GEP02702.1 hypothetical protein MOX02_07400 [Methylobacterium oxalidis]GJE33592.1 Ubiquinone biosynthesis O-methyltransferase, mitochondrial [Methylobacterium oxalidis]GLS66900.1 hypothetical protein GCM10007888_52830 [Methylobacterium oxalidis]